MDIWLRKNSCTNKYGLFCDIDRDEDIDVYVLRDEIGTSIKVEFDYESLNKLCELIHKQVDFKGESIDYLKKENKELKNKLSHIETLLQRTIVEMK